VWLIILSDQLPIVALVSRYLPNKLIGRMPICYRNPLSPKPCGPRELSGINPPFGGLSPGNRQVAYAFRTRLPVVLLPPDLHVLGLPLAFILSQDQTLHSIFFVPGHLCPETPE
jgi:hypothetical protein